MKAYSMSNEELRKAINNTDAALRSSMRDDHRTALTQHFKDLLKEEIRRAGEYVDWNWGAE